MKDEEFEKSVRPLIKYLCDNHHPHVSVIVTPISSEIVEGVANVEVRDYIRD